MAEIIDHLNTISIADEKNDDENHPAWDDLIVCRVEVDLPTWMSKLAGGKWEVYAEDEDDHCVSFAMRQAQKRNVASTKEVQQKLAEVTLYHNGDAVVDVEGQSLFEGSLTTGETDCASLTYFNADSGEEIMLN